MGHRNDTNVIFIYRNIDCEKCMFFSTSLYFVVIFLILASSSDDWDAFLSYLGCLLEDDINWSKASVTDQIKPSKSVDFQNCKLSSLTEEVVCV